MLNLIACIDKYNSLGINNDLIYHFKEDLKIFKEKTLNNIVVMGRKTFESLNSSPLPNRRNIIISTTLQNPPDNSYEVIRDINEVLNLSKNKNVFIIGGKQLYEYFNPYYDEIHLTYVKDEFTKNYDKNSSIKLSINLHNFILSSSKDFEKFYINIYKKHP